MLGDNYCNLESLRSATCKGYATDAAKLFTLREFSSPVDFSDKTNWTTILINNLEREEDIAVQRRPLDSKSWLFFTAWQSRQGQIQQRQFPTTSLQLANEMVGARVNTLKPRKN